MVVGADGAFELIEDDGAGSGLDPDGFAVTPISFDQSSGCVSIGPASGATGILPDRRSWRVTFLGVSQASHLEATVDGVEARPTAATDGRLSISVAAAAATSVVRVGIGADPQPDANTVGERLFALLDAAQIDYEVKSRVHDIATSAHPLHVRMSHLQALELSRALESAVSEILLAR